jgi:hypothetical protein
MVQIITVSEKGFANVMRRLGDKRQIIKDPDMAFPVRGVARVWDRNVRSEGSQVGGWAELSPYTQRMRKARGYGPAHPILRQTGTLHRVAVRSLMDARGPKGSTGSGAVMSLSMPGRGRAVMRISGEKVRNHFGHRAKRIPARRFWFVNGAVTAEATKSLQRWYDRELRQVR